MRICMKTSKTNNKPDPIAIVISCVAALLRLIQGYNFNPMGGISLFSGSKVAGPLSWFLPLILLFVTDIILIGPLKQKGFDSFSPITFVVYGSFLFYVLLGKYFVTNNKVTRILMFSAMGSLQFFLITNFAVWAGADTVTFSRDFKGLLACYLDALPFFGYTLISDLFYSLGIFGIHALVMQKLAAKAEVSANS